jgi:hypothetical protein
MMSSVGIIRWEAEAVRMGTENIEEATGTRLIHTIEVAAIIRGPRTILVGGSQACAYDLTLRAGCTNRIADPSKHSNVLFGLGWAVGPLLGQVGFIPDDAAGQLAAVSMNHAIHEASVSIEVIGNTFRLRDGPGRSLVQAGHQFHPIKPAGAKHRIGIFPAVIFWRGLDLSPAENHYDPTEPGLVGQKERGSIGSHKVDAAGRWWESGCRAPCP